MQPQTQTHVHMHTPIWDNKPMYTYTLLSGGQCIFAAFRVMSGSDPMLERGD